jgi:hypothetical protein
MKAIGTNIVPEIIKNIATKSSTFFWIYNESRSLHDQFHQSNANCQKECAMDSNNNAMHHVKRGTEMLPMPRMAPTCQRLLDSVAYLVCLQSLMPLNQN